VLSYSLPDVVYSCSPPGHSMSELEQRRGRPSGRPQPPPLEEIGLEAAIGKLFQGLAGARAALGRRDFPTLIWTLERALETLRRLYASNEKTFPVRSEGSGEYEARVVMSECEPDSPSG